MAKPEPDRSILAPDAPFKAFVSPCSTCENFNTDPTNGKPFCPRRYWAEQKKRFDQEKDVLEPPPYILATGTDKDNALANPVWFNDGQSVLVWVAPILENRIMVNRDGTLATGTILNKDSFDTKYTRCKMLPVLPMENWAEMLTVGAYQEWDQLVVFPMNESQEQQDPGQAFTLMPPVQLGGVAKRLNFAFFCSLVSPRSDRLRSGT